MSAKRAARNGGRSADDVDLDKLGFAPGFLLRIAQLRAYERFFAQAAAQRLKPGEFSVLWVISRNPGIRHHLLGQRLMIKPAHMTKLVRLLETQGLVARRIPDEDRRAVELRLTTAGKGVVNQVAGGFFSYEDGLGGAGLSAAERRQLVLLLRKFIGLKGRAP